MAEHEHVVSLGFYSVIFAALMVLVAVTVGVYYVDLGVLNLPIALTIAVAKALLVVLYFMHVRYTAGLTAVAVVAGTGWLILLITMTIGDWITRDWLPLFVSS